MPGTEAHAFTHTPQYLLLPAAAASLFVQGGAAGALALCHGAVPQHGPHLVTNPPALTPANLRAEQARATIG